MGFVDKVVALGTVVLVTLAERPWVSTATNEYLPGAKNVDSLEVFYARETPAPRAPPGSCALTASKRHAMSRAIEATIAKLGKGTTWNSLISIGDSIVERNAAQDLGREYQRRGVFQYTKTIKLNEHPAIEVLTAELRTLTRRI